MITNIMNNLPPFEKINPSFHMLLSLSLSMLVPFCVMVHCNIDNNDYAVPIGFKDANESLNNIDDDDNIDFT